MCTKLTRKTFLPSAKNFFSQSEGIMTHMEELGFERYRIFVPLSRVRMLIPGLDWNNILLPGQLPLSHELYFLRLRQEFLAPLFFYILGTGQYILHTTPAK